MLKKTISDLKPWTYLLTRFNPKLSSPDDLDILVTSQDFDRVVVGLKALGYTASSHDHALGGRIAGVQLNLTRPGRIKIDLHKDFTWRRHRYLDLNLLWKKYPQVNKFLVMINIIFEKTYLLKHDYLFLKGLKEDSVFQEQSKMYSWPRTYKYFWRWWSSLDEIKQFPVFLSSWLVLISFFEKFDFVSFIYYLFFRIRNLVNGVLPYDSQK